MATKRSNNARNKNARLGLAKKARGKQGARRAEIAGDLRERSASGRLNERYLVAAVSLALESSGQCTKANPWKPMGPILDDKGLRFCCEHRPRHCSGYISVSEIAGASRS